MKRARFRNASRLAVLALVAAIAAGLTTTLVLSPWAAEDDASGEQRFAGAASDEEWIDLIREGKRLQEEGGKAPAPFVPPDTTLVEDCSQLPPTVVATQSATEPDPSGESGQIVFYFTDEPTSERFMLVVRWEAPPDFCVNEAVTGMVGDAAKAAPQRYSERDFHICEEMERMARGEPKTDHSLRDASPAVASEYLETFCRDLPEPVSPPAGRGPS